MKAGEIALASLQQADGQLKMRPVLLLTTFPPFDDWLVCGISSQIRHAVSGLDNVVEIKDADFEKSGLQVPSVIRTGFLATLPSKDIPGTIGSISSKRYHTVINQLVTHINQS